MTKETVIHKALSKVGIQVRNGLDADDYQNGLDAYSFTYAELLDDGIVTWAEGGDIPERLAGSLIDIMAWKLVDDYPVANVNTISAKASIADKRIRRQLASGQDSAPVSTEYF